MVTFLNFLDLVNKRIGGFLKSMLNRITTQLSKLKMLPVLIAKKSKDILKGIVTFITKKPSDLSDYVLAGKRYIAKRSLLAIILLIAALVLCTIWFAVPFVNKTFFAAKITVNTPEFHTANGNAEVYNVDGTLLYSGKMVNGFASGSGKLFIGDALIYQGDFDKNEYEGSGKLYDENGALVYKGQFSLSKYNGEGEIYYPNGQLKVSGNFIAGKLNGYAVMYDEKGIVVYDGNFTNDDYNGNGKLYENGKLKYDGDFVNGEITGSGTLYDSDGSKIYSGGFVNGYYNGQGILYDYAEMNDGEPMRLEGEFTDGKPDGQATLYNFNGEPVFNGIMNDDGLNYISFISSSKAAVESSFTAKATLRTIGEKSLLYYSDLEVGFVLDSNDKVDRIIITGGQQLFGARNGINNSSYQPPENAVKYAEYSFLPTDSDIKLLQYINIDFDSAVTNNSGAMSCQKYIADNVFIKLYYFENEIVYYEIGTV